MCIDICCLFYVAEFPKMAELAPEKHPGIERFRQLGYTEKWELFVDFEDVLLMFPIMMKECFVVS